MKCGVLEKDHDEEFCSSTDYPALKLASLDHCFTVAKLFEIDLTKANEKSADGGRHGSEEGDIFLEIACLIHDFNAEKSYMMETDKMKKLGLINFIGECLDDWGFEFHDRLQAYRQIPKLMRYGI